MAKKQHDETEALRVRVKDLEQTNKVLRRRLRKLEDYHQQKDDLQIEAEIKEEMEEVLKQQKEAERIQNCPDCNSVLSTIKMANRTFNRCSKHPLCRYRTPAVIGEE